AVRSYAPSTQVRTALKTTAPSTVSLDRGALKFPLHNFGSIEIRSEAILAPVTSRPGYMILTAPAASSDRHTAVKLARAAGLPVSFRRALGKPAASRKFCASFISSNSVTSRATRPSGSANEQQLTIGDVASNSSGGRPSNC